MITQDSQIALIINICNEIYIIARPAPTKDIMKYALLKNFLSLSNQQNNRIRNAKIAIMDNFIPRT